MPNDPVLDAHWQYHGTPAFPKPPKSVIEDLSGVRHNVASWYIDGDHFDLRVVVATCGKRIALSNGIRNRDIKLCPDEPVTE